MREFRQIAIYGKGGVGKSTVTANLAVCLTEMGRKVMQVGCSPKSDSTYLLLGRMCEPTILDNIRQKGLSSVVVNECIKVGYKGIVCAEAGGPEPAAGCAGRGVFHALELLKRYMIYERYGVNFILYDVIADVICGGFSQPMRRGYASAIYIVTSGELMSLYSTNNICAAVMAMNELQGVTIKVGGLINNMRDIPNERELVEEIAEIIGVPVVGSIPRSRLVQEAEGKKGTVMQHFPNSDVSDAFREVAKNVLEPRGVLPQPMDTKESISRISRLLRKYQVFACSSE